MKKKSNGRTIEKRGLCIVGAVILGSMLCVNAAALEETDTAVSTAVSV